MEVDWEAIVQGTNVTVKIVQEGFHLAKMLMEERPDGQNQKAAQTIANVEGNLANACNPAERIAKDSEPGNY